MTARVRAGALAVLVALLCLLAPPAAAVESPAPAPRFGAALDWGSDSAAAYSDRLGRRPALFAKPVVLPLTDDERRFVTEFVDQVARQGAEGLLVLEPTVPLAQLQERDLREVAERLRTYDRDHGVRVSVSLAPAMNLAERPWGQAPQAYVAAFRALAAAVDELSPDSDVLWAPAAEVGAVRELTATEQQALDTDGSGTVDGRDDPWAPYWPGAEHVDAVGLVAPYVSDGEPAPAGTWRGLVGEFARTYDAPFVADTTALHDPDLPETVRAAVVGGWARQVLTEGPASTTAVVWTERDGPDGLTGRATASPVAADALLDALVGTGTVLGRPGVAVEPRRPTSEPVGERGTTVRGPAAWALAALGVATVLGLLLLGRSPRSQPWRYDDPGARDLRVDWLRGVAIVFVVLNHLTVPSLWHLLSQEALGPFSGAELFVALSGVVLGLVHGPRVRGGELPQSSLVLLARARTLYLTALVVVTTVFLVSQVPGVSDRAVTTFTDTATGETYDLYAGFRGVFEAGLQGYNVRDLLLLRSGPYQFNIMGLYVVLLVLTPLALWLLRRRRVLVLLGLSVALYVLDQLQPVRLLPSQFEDAFPLLTWQLLFFGALAVGWYRTELLRAASRPRGQAVVAAAVVLYAAVLLVSWSNPYLSNAADVRLALVGDEAYRSLYDAAFARRTLEVGRLLAVVVGLVSLYALLTAFWRPLHRALGWLLVPLGQATLYVFVLQVFVALAVDQLPAVDGSLLLGTLVHTASVALLWLAVRTRFLFRVVPR